MKTKILKKVTASSRENSGKIIDENHAVIQQGHLPLSENYSKLPVTRGNLNPLFRQDITKNRIIIRSKNRKIYQNPNIDEWQFLDPSSSDLQNGCASLTEIFGIPGKNADTMFMENGNNFTCTLSSRVKDCIRLEVEHVEIPISWYAFCWPAATNRFWAGPTSPSGEDFYPIDVMDASTKLIKIPCGNYTKTELINGISNEFFLQNQLYDISLNPNTQKVTISLSPSSTDTSFNLFFYLHPTSEVNKTAHGIHYNIPAIPSKFVDPSGKSQMKVDHNLGWLLGFRKERYMGQSSYTSEGVIDVYGPKTITITIDEFSKNVALDNVIHIKEDNEKFGRPKGIEDCNAAVRPATDPIVSPEAVLRFGLCRPPRDATHPDRAQNGDKIQAQTQKGFWAKQQLLRFNTKIQKRQAPPSQVFVRLQIKKNDGPIIFASPKAIRQYFGPIDINKLRITISEDLNESDWSISLVAHSLYQY